MHEQYRFLTKATYAFVCLVMKDLTKFCFTHLENQRAKVISLKGNFPPKASK